MGGFEGWRAHVSLMPERRLGVAVVTNSGGSSRAVINLIAAYIYDRLRENRSKFVPRGKSFAEQMNDAVNQTLSRTILTALTTFLSAAILLFFGGKTLEDFAFVLFIGVITGTYSTTYVAAALVVDWTQYVEGRLRRRKKAVAKA